MNSEGSLQCSVIGLNDSPMCPLRGDGEEMDLDHIQKCQNLTDTMDNISNPDRWWKSSRFFWNARKKMENFPFTGVG